MINDDIPGDNVVSKDSVAVLIASRLLEKACAEDITLEDESFKEPPENRAGVVSPIPRLELTFMDSELVMSALLETGTDKDIAAEDKTTTVLSEDITGAL